MAADKEAVEFALTTLVAWLEDEGYPEIGGIISRNGMDYQFELKQLGVHREASTEL